MKSVIISLMLLVTSLYIFAEVKNDAKTIYAEDLKMDDLFSHSVEIKDKIMVGEALQPKIQLTYKGNEPIYIHALSCILIKGADGNFRELIYYNEPPCYLEGIALDAMAPPDPVRLIKNQSYNVSPMAFHKGDGHLYFEREGQYEVCFEISFFQLFIGPLGEKEVKAKRQVPKITTQTYKFSVIAPTGEELKIWKKISENGLQPFLAPCDMPLHMRCWIKDLKRVSALENLITSTNVESKLLDRLKLGYALSLIEYGMGEPLKNWEKASASIDSIKTKDVDYYREILGELEDSGCHQIIKAKVKEKVKTIYQELERNPAFSGFLNEWKARRAQSKVTLRSERAKHEEEQRRKKYEEERKSREKKQ